MQWLWARRQGNSQSLCHQDVVVATSGPERVVVAVSARRTACLRLTSRVGRQRYMQLRGMALRAESHFCQNCGVTHAEPRLGNSEPAFFRQESYLSCSLWRGPGVASHRIAAHCVASAVRSTGRTDATGDTQALQGCRKINKLGIYMLAGLSLLPSLLRCTRRGECKLTSFGCCLLQGSRLLCWWCLRPASHFPARVAPPR